MVKRKISEAVGQAALQTAMAELSGYARGSGDLEPSIALKTATRFLLEELQTLYPGKTLEVRVPPYGAVQCVDGPAHKRGTPPNVIECDPETWLKVATGLMSFAEAKETGRLTASGVRADLNGLLPLYLGQSFS